MKLTVLLHGVRMGSVSHTSSGKLMFLYDKKWINWNDSMAMSQSMPMTTSLFPDAVVSNFLWGLLPDNEHIINQIAKMGEPTSPRSVLGLLSKVGEDCAGALQFVTDERLPIMKSDPNVKWLSDQDIGERLRLVKNRSSVALNPAWTQGRFSLAGAQPKFALTQDPFSHALGEPTGGTPTTHIFKPPMEGMDGQVENEHFCLSLAALLGIPAAESKVRIFDGEAAIVVKRYDRFEETNGYIRRLHQEDMCQALAISPFNKYQADGGPSIKTIVTKVLATSNQPEIDIRTFIRAQVLNFLIVGTDAHGKNYSVLYGKNGKHRLAPLYDINSFLPYESDDKSKLAMSIDGKYKIREIYPRHWERLSRSIDVPYEDVMGYITEMAHDMPDAAHDVAAGCRHDGLNHQVLTTLTDKIAERCRKVTRDFATASAFQVKPEA